MEPRPTPNKATLIPPVCSRCELFVGRVRMRRFSGPLVKMSKPNRKVVTSALALIPPNDATVEGGLGDLWPPIQKIREVHDKSFVRWSVTILLQNPIANQASLSESDWTRAATSRSWAPGCISNFPSIIPDPS